MGGGIENLVWEIIGTFCNITYLCPPATPHPTELILYQRMLSTVSRSLKMSEQLLLNVRAAFIKCQSSFY